ncbi:MAG TPA: BTAD domain-containing putative transcriptional regulator [Acidimicrobiales bacterium]|nr:BTAD domain-containing putative transcriptional regulator [Acidimicrobiales bacterium]
MISVRLLGPVEVDANGDAVALSRTLERALLARLALLPGQPVSSERLIDDLWGNHAPRDGAASLQGLVYRLRRTLGSERCYILRADNGYALDPDVDVDATTFDQLVARARATRGSGHPEEAPALLREALDLWRGPPLAGLESLPFASTQATRLNAARLAALGDRVHADLAAGRHREVIAELESLVAEHPYQERFWSQLMLALYRAGSQADALRCYSRLRNLLNEEMGIAPGPTVSELEKAILKQDPTLAWVPASLALAGGIGSLPHHPTPRTVEDGVTVDTGGTHERSDLSWVPLVSAAAFVGRRAELDVARAARRKAVAGEQHLILITGEPGIGKTRLTAEIARECDSAGDLVLQGRWDEEPLCPYQAFREALGRYALRTPEELVQSDAGSLIPVLARIVPEVLENRAGGPPARAEVDGDRYQVFDAVNRWVRAIAGRRRLVLVLDDMHWADRPSLLLLEYLLRSSTQASVLIVATYRQTDANVSGWFSESLAGIRRTTSVECIALRGLSAAETQELLESAIGRTLSDHEATGAANLQRHTGGNPFFLQEVVRDLREAGRSLEAWSVANAEELMLPERMRDVVRWRLRQLSAVCMRVLSAASALGDEFDIGTVCDAIDCDEETLLLALDEARLAGVITESRREFDTHCFTHAVVRQALYHELGLSRRTRLHRELGKSLEIHFGPDARRHASELAHHYYLGASAGGVNDALRYLRLAADDALQQVAYEAAADHLGRALELVTEYRASDIVERCQLLLAIGKACVKAGRNSEADTRFLDAFEGARGCGRADLLAEAALGYGGVLPAGSEPNEKARAILESALAGLPTQDGSPRALVLGRLAQWGHFDRPRAERQRLLDDAVDMARRLGDPETLAAVLRYQYWAMDGPDEIDQQISVAIEIAGLGEKIGDNEVRLHGLKCELHARFELGDYEASRRVAADLCNLAAQIQQPEYLRLGYMWDSLVAGTEGRYGDAELNAAEAAAILERTEHPQLYALYIGLSLPWRWLQGRMEELRPLLELGKTGRASLGEQALVAWVASEIGERAQAETVLAGLVRADVVGGDRNFHWWFLMVGLTQTALNLGDRAWAATLYELIEPYADHNCRAGQATFLGAASLQLGGLALLLGRENVAVLHLEKALARHTDMEAWPLVAMTKHLLAQALRKSRLPRHLDRADVLDDEARVVAAALGAPRAVTSSTL